MTFYFIFGKNYSSKSGSKHATAHAKKSTNSKKLKDKGKLKFSHHAYLATHLEGET